MIGCPGPPNNKRPITGSPSPRLCTMPCTRPGWRAALAPALTLAQAQSQCKCSPGYTTDTASPHSPLRRTLPRPNRRFTRPSPTFHSFSRLSIPRPSLPIRIPPCCSIQTFLILCSPSLRSPQFSLHFSPGSRHPTSPFPLPSSLPLSSPQTALSRPSPFRRLKPTPHPSPHSLPAFSSFHLTTRHWSHAPPPLEKH
jgi:hypothetical protein